MKLELDSPGRRSLTWREGARGEGVRAPRHEVVVEETPWEGGGQEARINSYWRKRAIEWRWFALGSGCGQAWKRGGSVKAMRRRRAPTRARGGFVRA